MAREPKTAWVRAMHCTTVQLRISDLLTSVHKLTDSHRYNGKITKIKPENLSDEHEKSIEKNLFDV